MVGFLECPGPYLNPNSNTPPKWNNCAGSEYKPCPCCGTICSNSPAVHENCQEPSCNCCLKSVSTPVLETQIVECCKNPVSSQHNFPQPEYYICPWCGRGISICRNQQKVIPDHQQSPLQNTCIYCRGIRSILDPNSTIHTINMKQNCTKCPSCPCNYRSEMNPASNGQQLNTNQTQNISGKIVECRPKKSAFIIGGKMVSCHCSKRNGLQDDCRLWFRFGEIWDLPYWKYDVSSHQLIRMYLILYNKNLNWKLKAEKKIHRNSEWYFILNIPSK